MSRRRLSARSSPLERLRQKGLNTGWRQAARAPADPGNPTRPSPCPSTPHPVTLTGLLPTTSPTSMSNAAAAVTSAAAAAAAAAARLGSKPMSNSCATHEDRLCLQGGGRRGAQGEAHQEVSGRGTWPAAVACAAACASGCCRRCVPRSCTQNKRATHSFMSRSEASLIWRYASSCSNRSNSRAAICGRQGRDGREWKKGGGALDVGGGTACCGTNRPGWY